MLRQRIVRWIAPLEHVVRKLLFAEAAQLRGQVMGAREAKAPLRMNIFAARDNDVKDERALDLATPAAWPALFSLAPPRDPLLVPNERAPRIRALWFEPPPIARPHAHAPKPKPVKDCDQAFQLARRLEALRRVLDKPMPHVRRLARLLTRLRRRFPEVIGSYAAAPSRTCTFDPDDPRLGIECQAKALAVAAAFSNSS